MTAPGRVRLAFYIGTLENPARLLGDRLICRVTDSDYSHVELVRQMGGLPKHMTRNGEPWYGPTAMGLSSSYRDHGVREKMLPLDPQRWVVVECDGDHASAVAHIRSRIGTPYGLLDLLSFLLPWRVSTSADFCSEVVARALRLADAWHTSPGDLFATCMTRLNGQVVPLDEWPVKWGQA